MQTETRNKVNRGSNQCKQKEGVRMARKQRFYVVWQGRKPGVYNSWAECKEQVFQFEQALYKSFSTREEAERAFKDNPWRHLNSKKEPSSSGSSRQASGSTGSASGRIIANSIAVDAACSGNPGLMEYRGVYVGDGSQIFHHGPLEGGTNNIGEFLAIVHALALLKKKESSIPLYSDSVNAIKWIEKKKCNTKIEPTEQNRPVFELIRRAEQWLRENTFSNPILKWETRLWGENPADFGRK